MPNRTFVTQIRFAAIIVQVLSGIFGADKGLPVALMLFLPTPVPLPIDRRRARRWRGKHGEILPPG
jgi:hypothetical protein